MMIVAPSNRIHAHTPPSIEEYKKKAVNPKRIQGGLHERGAVKPVSRGDKPLVSLITIVYNGKKHITKTIQSVLEQTYDNVEYIIIDGGSKDGTLELILSYGDQISYWLSEPDEGISDAFNKGISVSHGSIIGLLNADDWLSRDQIELGVAALMNSSAQYVFGDLLFHDSSGVALHRMRGDPHYARVINSRMPDLQHPTVLVRKDAYEQIGLFDTRYRYAMDYEWLLRLHRHGGSGLYVPEIVGHMLTGGVSDDSYRKTLNEVRQISMHYGQTAVKANILYRYRIIKGFLKKSLAGWVPKSLYHFIRKIINPHYSSRIH